MKKWTKEQKDYLREIAPGNLDQVIADSINKKFNTQYTKSAINSMKRKLKIKSKRPWNYKWTEEVIQFMIDNYEGRDNIELANMVNERFHLNTNGDRISNVKSNLQRRRGINLRTGINRGCIEKGNIPFNKGKKWSEYLSEEQQEKSKKTWFKKGGVSLNHREVGSERITVDGIHEIKVAEPNVWKQKHRLIYESVYGEIPKKHKVIFADGNRDNLDISNLLLVSNAEELIMNRRHLITSDIELTKSGVNVAKLILKTAEVKNERKN